MQKFYFNNLNAKGFTKRIKIFAILFFTTLLSSSTFATVYNVTNTTDGNGINQLRGAILDADAAGGTHTINVAAGTYTLTLGQIVFGNTAQNITIIGAGAATTIIEMTGPIASRDRIFFINPSGTTNSPVISISGITFQGGYLNSDPYGGAAICSGGGSAESLTVTNCIFDSNTLPAGAYGGAAINMQVRGNLTIDNCIFTNNVSNDADGGAVLFILFNSALGTSYGTLNVTNSTFTSNSVIFPGAGTSNGGALAFTAQAGVTPYNVTINNNTFISNTADGLGGAISANNSANVSVLQVHFNRFFNNISTAGATSSGLHFVESSGSVNAENNWWGCNTNPVNGASTAPCNQAGGDVAGGGALDADPWLQLKTTASPNPICNTPAGLGNTTLVTTSFLSNSAGGAVTVANISRLIGLPVTWGPTTLGSLSGQEGTIQANGTATATFTSNGTGGTATVNTQVDNISAGETSPARASITINTIPTVTNPTNQTVCVGGTISFTSTINGTPAPTIQWYKGATLLSNSGPYSGVNTNTLTITNAQLSEVSANYHVVATNTCGTATSADASLTVNIPSVAPTSISGTTTFCNPGSTTLTAQGGALGTGANYQWGTGAVVGTSPLVGETNATFTVSPTSSTTYWVRIENTAAPCTANTGGVAQLVTVNQPSVAPTGATGTTTICTGTTTTLTVTGGTKGTGAVTEWFTGSCGGTLVFTGDAFTTPVLNSNTTYYVRYSGTCNTTTCAEVTVTVFNREINVQGNSTTIVDGDVAPSLTDHTDFGDVITGNNLVRTYTIQNTGTDNLTVSSITVSGGDAAQFTVGALSPASPIPGGGSATFTVTFAPTSTGVKSTTVIIANNDCDEASYDFAIQGTGTCVTDPVVTNNNNSGPGSLRQAVLEACPGSTITFSGVASPIILTTGEIVINKNLTIIGPGFNLLSISGNNNSRVFNIPSGITVDINNLTITKGYAASFGAGGGINNSGTITLTNMIFLENSAYAGGGLNNSGKAILNNVIFSKNNTYGSPGSGAGGALYTGTSANETSFYTNVVFSENSSGGRGGAVVVNGRPTNFINCTFYGNSAFDRGGAMYNVNFFVPNQVQITNCIFRGNIAPLFADIDNTFNFGVPTTITTSLFGVDPLFVNAADPDGPDNLWITGDDGLRLQSGSPAVNTGTAAGAPATDILGVARLGNTDMGAYEFGCAAPTFTNCPGNQPPVNNTPGLCSAIVTYTATATGTPAPTLTYQFTGATTGSGSGTGSGSTFNVGVTTVTITATNLCGNPTCTFTVTVVDNQAPSLVGLPPAIVNVSCSANVPAPPTVTATDNCGVVPVIYNEVKSEELCVNKYKLTRTWTATDASSNSISFSQIITVNDNQAPSLVGLPPAIVNVSCSANVPAPPTVTATDNCGDVTVIYTEVKSEELCVNKFKLTRTWTATDACNNSISFEQIITVNDNQAPSLVGLPPAIVNVSCSANVPAPPTVTASDNCGVVPVIYNEVKSEELCVNKFKLTRTWTATDACNNSISFEQIITVNDNLAPIPPVFAQVLLEYKCIADIPAAPTVNGTDNCDGTVPGVLVVTNNGGTGCVSSPLIYTRTWTFTDQCGNSSTAVQTVKVVDDVAPSITNASVNPTTLWPPNHKMRDVYVNYTAEDNCGTVTTSLSVTSNEPINGTGDGDTSPDWIIGNDGHSLQLRAERAGNGTGRIYTITITATDACGNTSTKTVTVVVAHDITSPVTGASYKIGSTVNFAGTFWDKPGNRHTASWLVDGTSVAGSVTAEPSGLKNGTVTGAYKFGAAGVYKLQMNVKDQNGVVSYANTRGDMDAIVVIYDPNGGYTYGGGYFNSPAGSLKSNSTATGKVSYGFISNYFKGANNPKGETQMQFQIGNLEFNALNFDYLAISGAKAQYKGSGKIKGDQSGYSFIMTVIDGAIDGSVTDKIRLKIYNKNTGAVIYDNQPGASDAADPTTVVGSGSTVVIVNPSATITAGKINPDNVVITQLFEAKVLPNPTNDHFVLQVQTSGRDPIHINVMDILGRKVKEMKVGPYQTVMFGSEFIHGVYFVEIKQGSNRKVIKLEKL